MTAWIELRWWGRWLSGAWFVQRFVVVVGGRCVRAVRGLVAACPVTVLLLAAAGLAVVVWAGVSGPVLSAPVVSAPVGPVSVSVVSVSVVGPDGPGCSTDCGGSDLTGVGDRGWSRGGGSVWTGPVVPQPGTGGIDWIARDLVGGLLRGAGVSDEQRWDHWFNGDRSDRGGADRGGADRWGADRGGPWHDRDRDGDDRDGGGGVDREEDDRLFWQDRDQRGGVSAGGRRGGSGGLLDELFAVITDLVVRLLGGAGGAVPGSASGQDLGDPGGPGGSGGQQGSGRDRVGGSNVEDRARAVDAGQGTRDGPGYHRGSAGGTRPDGVGQLSPVRRHGAVEVSPAGSHGGAGLPPARPVSGAGAGVLALAAGGPGGGGGVGGFGAGGGREAGLGGQVRQLVSVVLARAGLGDNTAAAAAHRELMGWRNTAHGDHPAHSSDDGDPSQPGTARRTEQFPRSATAPPQTSVAEDVRMVGAGMELTNHDGTTLMITPGTSSPHSQITAEPGRGRFLIGIDNHLAPGSYDFDLSMPAGARAVTSADGGVDILDTTGQTVQSIAAPWAKDANGVQLPTRFEVIDNGDGSTTLRQHVAFDEATAFPVLADPAKKTSGSKKTDGKKTDGKKAPAKDKAPAKPAEEKPAGDKPAEKSPAGGKPAEEKPAGDKPVEDKPAAEKAAEEKPATAAAPDEQRDPAAAPPVPEEPADTIDGQPKFTFADDTGATDTTVTNADHPQVPGAPGMPEEPAPGPPGCFGGTCEPGAIPGLLPGAVEVPAAGAGTLPPGAPPHLGPLLDPRPSAAPGAPAVPGLLPGAVPVEPVLPIGGVPGTSLDPVLGQPGASVPLAPGAPFRADAPAPLTGSGPAQDEGWGPSDWGHLALDVLGLVPLLGEPADLANAAWYEAEGDHLNAGLSLAGAIPGLGWGATGGKLLGKGVQLLDSGSDATRIADAARATDNATPPAPRPGLPTAPSGTPPPLPGANAIPLLRGLTAADNLLGDTPPTNTPSGTPTTPDTVPTTPGTQPDVDTPTVRDPDHDRPTAPTRPDGVQPLPRGDRYIDGVTYRWDDDNQRWNPIAWEHGATPDHTGHPLDDRLRGASTTPGDSGSTGFRESDRDEVDAALGLAAATRTPTGGVDPAALRELMDSLPEPGDALAQFAAQSVGSPEVTLVPVGGEGAVGYSGAPVNLILGAGGEVLGVLKVFPRAEEFARELSALQRLGSLTQVGGVLPLGVARTAGPAGGGVLVSSAAPGRGIDQLMLEVGRARGAERAAKFADLRDTISAAGRALADLHAAGGASGTPPSLFIQRHVDAMRDIAAKLDSNQGLLAEEAGIDTTELRHRVEQLIAQLRANPGGSAIVHGDAHPGNLFYDPAAGITMIDTPTLHLSLDAEGAPIGAPARDVAYLAHKLAYFGPGWGLEPDEVIELQQVFRQAYADGGGAGVTAEAEAFFRARAALGELITSVNRAERLKEYAALRSRAALFRDALGVKDVSSAG